MWGWIVGAVAVVFVLALVWLFLRGGVYRKLFANEHVIEFSRGLGRIKAAAISNPLTDDSPPPAPDDDPRVLITSAGLLMLYTVRVIDERFVHHYSISVGGGFTAHAVGEQFALLAARCLGVPYDQLALGVGVSTVHHAEFELSADENDSFRDQPVLEMTAADVDGFRQEWTRVREQLHWQREPT